MKFLKKIFLWLLFAAVLAGLFWIFFNKFIEKDRSLLSLSAAPAALDKPCNRPLKFAIGSVDPRFNITADQVKTIAVQAADIWNKASGRQLLEYDPNAKLQIKLVYDQRQRESDAADQLNADLENLSVQKTTLDKQYGGLTQKYDQSLADFKSNLADYQKKLDSYDQEVAKWNAQGGAPPPEYDKLTHERKDLDSELKNLQSEESDLKHLADQINGIAAKENNIVSNYNSQVSTFQSEYGGSQEFEKGVFNPSQGIDIYQFRAADDLRMTIAHELGHALGMQHVQNPKSIMYYLMQDQDLKNPAPTAEDMVELKSVCKLN